MHPTQLQRFKAVFFLAALCCTVQPVFAQPFPIAACSYSPTSSVFIAGQTKFEHFLSHSGSPNEPNTQDGFRILLPDVAHPFHIYHQIPLHGGDTFMVTACGCVQTGGKGKTWKRYVDPSGDNSDRFYHGLIQLIYDNQVPPPGGWMSNMRTIQNWMINQGNSGIAIPKGHTAKLVLGYQDDDYGDNGYWGHDDGTEDQCRDTGGAAVEIIVTHH